jgi:hypothetical protein
VRDDGLLALRDEGLGDTSRANSAIDQVLTGGQTQTVGRFRFFIDDERWEWSDEVQQIHGYVPGEMPNLTTRRCCPTSIRTTTTMSSVHLRTLELRVRYLAPGTA